MVIPLLALVAFLAAWTWFLHKRSDRRMWSPLWLAFTTTAVAVLFIVSGSLGYILSKRARFGAGTAWSDTVLWWEVGAGIVLVPLALYFWRRGLRDVDRRLPRS